MTFPNPGGKENEVQINVGGYFGSSEHCLHLSDRMKFRRVLCRGIDLRPFDEQFTPPGNAVLYNDGQDMAVSDKASYDTEERRAYFKGDMDVSLILVLRKGIVEVPDIVGEDESDVAGVLKRKARLVPGNSTTVAGTPTVPKVVSQDPPAGSKIEMSSPVDYVVEWNISPNVTTLEPDSVTIETATIRLQLDLENWTDDVILYMQWRRQGESVWNTTSTKVRSQDGTYTWQLTGLLQEEWYQCKAFGDWNGNTAEGQIVEWQQHRAIGVFTQAPTVTPFIETLDLEGLLELHTRDDADTRFQFEVYDGESWPPGWGTFSQSPWVNRDESGNFTHTLENLEPRTVVRYRAQGDDPEIGIVSGDWFYSWVDEDVREVGIELPEEDPRPEEPQFASFEITAVDFDWFQPDRPQCGYTVKNVGEETGSVRMTFRVLDNGGVHGDRDETHQLAPDQSASSVMDIVEFTDWTQDWSVELEAFNLETNEVDDLESGILEAEQ